MRTDLIFEKMVGPKMKIVYVSENFPPYSFGGGELSGFTLAKFLAADPDFEVQVVTSAAGGKEVHETMENILVHRVIPEGSKRLPDDIRRGEVLTHNTKKYLKQYLTDCDIVHTISMRVTTGAFKATNKKNVPIISTVNDSWATCYYSLHLKGNDICWNCTAEDMKDCLDEYGGNKLALPYILHNMKKRAKILKQFDCLLPRSKLIEELLHKNGFSNQMLVFPPIIDLDKYKFKSMKNTKQVLFIGRLDRGKGVEDAILAIKHTSDAHLMIIGDGPYRKEFEKLSIKNSLEDRVTFKGKLSEDDVIKAIHGSDLILAPFRRLEPMPRILPEAFACGRPIITTDVCGGNELVKNGVNGYVAGIGDVKKMGQHIDDVISNKKLLKDLGENGRSTFEKQLHPENIMKNYKNLLRDLEKE